MIDFLKMPEKPTKLSSKPGTPEVAHVFEESSIQAVNGALAASRPLLIRGEPGRGKSQMARAVAQELGRAFIQHVVDAQAESRDLLWHFDAVERLAEAQLRGALGEKPAEVREKLAVHNYLRPGPLWWAFNWDGALQQADKVCMPAPPQRNGGSHENGCVLLIDEIDKAETDLPNGLLEALGNGEFTPFGSMEPVVATVPGPLVIITTNEERTLPDAFIRRCLVLHLALPEEGADLKKLLVSRGKAHFYHASAKVLEKAADLLVEDRNAAKKRHLLPLPGQAEYLDLVRAVLNYKKGDKEAQIKALDKIAVFTFKKHSGATDSGD